MASNTDIKMRYEITADGSKAKATFSELDKIINKMQGGGTLGGIAANASKEWGSLDALFGKVTNSLGSIPVPAAAAVGAIAGIGAAAMAVGEKLFSMAQAASEVGRSVAGFEKITGFTAESASTLAFAASLSGKALADLQRPTLQLVTVMSKAKDGSDAAIQSLARLGVTKFDDLDSALNEISKTFAAMPDGPAKTQLAIDTFGKRGAADMIKVLAKMGSSFDEFKAKAAALGVTLTEDDVKAAKEFGHAYETLEYQLKLASAHFALEYAPAITDGLKDIIKWLADNKDEWSAWGKAVGGYLSDIKTAIEGLGIAFKFAFDAMTFGMGSFISTGAAVRATVSSIMDGLFPLAALLREMAHLWNIIHSGGSEGGQYGLDKPLGGGTVYTGVDNARSDISPRDSAMTFNRGAGRTPRIPKDTSARDAERLAARESSAKISGEQNNLKQFEQDLNDELDKSIAKFKEFGDSKAFLVELGKAFAMYNNNVAASLQNIEALENAERSRNTEAENTLLTQNQLIRREDEKRKIEKISGDAREEIARKDKEIADEAERAMRKAIDATYERIEAEKKLADSLPLASTITPPNASPIIAPITAIQNALAGLRDIGTSAFSSLAQGIGSTIENMVLMGTAGPHAMRKLVASILAGVAAQAAIKAIYELAEGFAALANPFLAWTAPMHFKSAALFAIVAGVAGVAGRFVAGNTFSQQTGAATGTGSGASAAPQNNNFGGQFHGFQQRQTAVLASVMDRSNAVLGAVADSVDRFNQKFGIASPSDVVMAGAGGASAAIFNAHTSELSKGGRGTEQIARLSGRYR